MSYGEKITGESWVMRDIWQTTNIDYRGKNGLASFPKKLKSSGIKRLIERALWDQGLRKPLQNGEKRHEWKTAHIHNIGLSCSYYKPTEREVLEDYLRAVELLTINDSNTLQEKIVSLEETVHACKKLFMCNSSIRYNDIRWT